MIYRHITQTIRWQFMLAFFSLVLFLTAILGSLAYRTSRNIIAGEAMERVGMAANAREQILLRVLKRHQGRAGIFLKGLQARCGVISTNVGCLRDILGNFIAAENVTAAQFIPRDGIPVTIPEEEAPFPDTPIMTPDQLALFSTDDKGKHYYIVRTVSEKGDTLTLRFDTVGLHEIFLSRHGLGGESGETFLADSRGFFITPTKYPGVSGESHPIQSESMKQCLAGQDSQGLFPDYRGVMTFMGFRHIEEIGGGCLMAQVEEIEAMAPARQLRTEVAGVSGLFAAFAIMFSLIFARRLSRPIDLLTARVRGLQAGDFDGPVPINGPSEIRTFAQTFAAMALFLKESRAALVASEGKIRAVLENALDAVIGMDEEGNITDWNTQAEALFGWRREEAIGRKVSETIIPYPYREGHGGLDRFFISGDPLILNRRIEMSASRRDGSECLIELSMTPIQAYDSTFFYAFISDITERKRAEELLRESQQKYKALVNSIEGIVWEADPKTFQFSFVSKQAERILGYPGDQWLNDPSFWRDHIYPEDREWAVPFCMKSTREKKDQDFQYRMIAADGRVVWLRDLVSVIVENDRPVKLRGVMVDITDPKRTEEELKQKTAEAQEASRIKSEFVSNTSHELRTPLNAIIGYAALALDETSGSLSEKRREFLEGVERNANDLLQLVNQLLDLSKIDSGKISVEVSEVDLSSLMDEILSDMRPLFEEKHLGVDLAIDRSLPRIQSDAGKIKQVLVNLLSNALKFTKEGGMTLTARNRPEREGVEVEVKDTGIGISPEELPKIFDTFHQVDATATREYGGVGLGLAIVKQTMHLLKGEIQVQSQYGAGSTFTVFLPYQYPE